MIKIIAQAFPHGVTSGGLTESLATVETTEDLPTDACGEVLVDCLRRALARGFDPTGADYNIVVTFKQVDHGDQG
jgi:hypothetical protein